MCLNLIASGMVHAQGSDKGSIENVAINKVETFFNTSIEAQSMLFNGPAYLSYGSSVDGSAYFQDLDFSNGSVIYDGFRYNNVPLQYDLYLDKVVSVLYGKSRLFSLVSEKVSDFYINNHHFVYIGIAAAKTAPIESGFFDLIYKGKLRILVKRVKKLQFTLNAETPYYFKPKTTYYLERDDKYYEFDNESSFLSLFKERKNELKRHLAERKIKFKNDPERAMVIMATYFERLLN
ncbi:MAG: hypothetical protein WC622_06130 [Pedobacter sp.]|jgi:hypothetical protein|uniref:hypothetical protein n=1 Tax=Pedobacter sp. TaxID=1411316 RepID=UPI003564B90D